MTIILDGTTGITAPVITTPGASINTNISYTGTLTGGTGVVNLGSGQLVKDAAGNVGLGVTPSAWYSAYKAMQLGISSSLFGSTSGSAVWLNSNAYKNASNVDTYIATATASSYQQLFGSHTWFTAPSGTAGNAIAFTQAMTLDASGNLLVGTTTHVGGAQNNNSFDYSPSLQAAIINHVSGTPSTYTWLNFGYSTSIIGSIAQVGTTGTLYNTTSDYRLKTVIGPVADAGTRIDSLLPVEYEWKADGARTRGFLAHQFQEVYAGSVTGTKDAVDEDGKPKYQAMQASSSEVIADLVAEIQSLRKRLTALENK